MSLVWLLFYTTSLAKILSCILTYVNVSIYTSCMHDETVEVLKALADDVRLGLVRKIASNKQPRLTCEIISECSHLSSLSQPTISHHIQKLVTAGVLIEEKHAQQKSYQLNTARLKSLGIDPKKL